LNGKTVVRPDGMLELGPYGSVQVAGLTASQARAAMEQHLAYYIRNPKVSLSPLTPGGSDNFQQQTAQRSSPSPVRQVAATDQRPWERGGGLRQGPGTRPAGVSLGLPGKARANPVLPVAWQSGQPVGERRAHPPTAAGSTVLHFPNPVQVGPAGPEACASAPPSSPPGASPVPTELRKVSLPAYIIEPPDVLLVETPQSLEVDQPIRGQHLVRPDGTVSLGIYGSVYVAGLTLDQAREAIYRQLKTRIEILKPQDVSVDVVAYNSKVYYIITDGGGYGEQVTRVPITGSETVLDALGLINGLPPVASKKDIWIARRTPGDAAPPQILPVDWAGITQRGSVSTNYQIFPGDRIYVKADKWIAIDNGIAKRLSPIERLFGATLLGSETVNSIRGRGLGTR
jgi:polysaccharide export outer membrane protein